MSFRAVDDVLADVMGRVRPLVDTEILSLLDARNRFLAEDIRSPVDVPPADNSAMDGFVFRYGDVAMNVPLDVSDRIAAGHPGRSLEQGTVARIFTGAEIPAGADTVVVQEDTRRVGEMVVITEMPGSGDNVRPCGQDVKKGDVILESGSCLTPSSLGLIASVGIGAVSVFRQLRVAVMSTGDELVEPGTRAGPGRVYNSNRYVLSGLLRDLGMQVVDIGIVGDTPAATEAALEEASSADCILSSGGVSVGEEDHVTAAVEKLGSLDIRKLAIKPGKPLAHGEVKGVPFFGLPGNPVSNFVTFMVVAKPYLIARAGGTDSANPSYPVEADFSFKAGSRREYARVRTRTTDDGRVVAELFPDQGSGVMTSVVWGNALAQIEPGRQVAPGDAIRVFPY